MIAVAVAVAGAGRFVGVGPLQDISEVLSGKGMSEQQRCHWRKARHSRPRRYLLGSIKSTPVPDISWWNEYLQNCDKLQPGDCLLRYKKVGGTDYEERQNGGGGMTRR